MYINEEELAGQLIIFVSHSLLSQVCREDITVPTLHMRRKLREIRYLTQSPQLVTINKYALIPWQTWG